MCGFAACPFTTLLLLSTRLTSSLAWCLPGGGGHITTHAMLGMAAEFDSWQGWDHILAGEALLG